MKPNSYKLHDCCWNCAHVFVERPVDGESEFFCHEDRSDRPVSWEEFGDGQRFLDASWDERRKVSRAWDAWSEPRRVVQFGMCDEYESGVEYCPDCEMLSRVSIEFVDNTVELKGVEVKYQRKTYRCECCETEFMTPGMLDWSLAQARKEYTRITGIEVVLKRDKKEKNNER